MQPHHDTRSASSFNKVGADGTYDAFRPSYSAETLAHIMSLFPTAQKNSLKVIELGAGTGIFTRQLLAEDKIAKVTAVDPNLGMRQGFEKSVPKSDRVEMLDGYFEKIPVQDACADLVVAAMVSFLAVFLNIRV
jgi:ubiquinone/menaquinone biosynthesis C-methylase UbiE